MPTLATWVERNRYPLNGKYILSVVFEDDIFICSQLQRHLLFLSACFIYYCVSHSITRYSIYTQFLMFFLFVSSFSLQRSKNVCRRRLSLIGLIHTYRRWVSCRLNVILAIQLSIYRISIDLPLKFAYQDVRHLFFFYDEFC